MRVAKWGNSLAIRLPSAVVSELDLKEGDEISIRLASDRTLEIMLNQTREEALKSIRELSRPFPPGFRFDRDEANER
jgi:antitoxin MazE